MDNIQPDRCSNTNSLALDPQAGDQLSAILPDRLSHADNNLQDLSNVPKLSRRVVAFLAAPLVLCKRGAQQALVRVKHNKVGMNCKASNSKGARKR